MASLWKRPESAFWWACYTDRTGKRSKKSTAVPHSPSDRRKIEPNRKKALRMAEEFEAAACNRRTAQQARKVITALHQEITGEELQSTTMRDVVRDWIADKADTAPATLAFYKSSTKRFLDFLGESNPLPSDIQNAQLVQYRNNLLKTVSKATAKGHVKVLKMLFKAARRDGLTAEDPSEFLTVKQSKGKAAETARRPFTVPELRAILVVADDEWRSLITFGLYSGQRLGDLVRVDWANIDLARGELKLTTGKTGRRVVVPLADPLRRMLEAAPSSDDPHALLHPRSAALLGEEGRVATLSNQFRDILAAAGLQKKQAHRKKKGGEGRGARRLRTELSFHCLRRTATSLLHEAGIPAAVAQQFVGHDSEDVHASYVSIGRPALEAAAAALPDITS